MSEKQKKCDCGCTTDKYGFGKAVYAVFYSICILGVVLILALSCSGKEALIPVIFQSIFGR